jgi:hypothetical protein
MVQVRGGGRSGKRSGLRNVAETRLVNLEEAGLVHAGEGSPRCISCLEQAVSLSIDQGHE